MKRLLPVALFLVIWGCRPCEQPNVCMPECFVEAPTCESQDEDLSCFWKIFHDPLLDQLIERAICCNHDMKIARERICGARAIYRVEFSELLPDVDLNSYFYRVRNSQTLSDAEFLGGSFVNLYRAGFDASWEIDIFGKNLDKTRASGYEVAAQKANLRDTQITIVSEVAQTYMSIRSLQERVAITQKYIAAEKEIVDLVESRFEAGLTPGLDMETAKALLHNEKAVLPIQQAELKIAIYSMAILLGQNPESIATLFDEVEPLPSAADKIPAVLPSELLCRRPDVRSAEYEMLAAGARVLAARKEFFPTISLTGYFSYATGFYKNWWLPESRNWNLWPFGSLPIFRGGEIWANVDAQTAVQREKVYAYEKSVLKALKEVEDSLISYFKEKIRADELAKTVAANQSASEIAKDLYLAGKVNFLYVNEIERDLFISSNTHALSRERVMTNLISIYKTLGGGW